MGTKVRKYQIPGPFIGSPASEVPRSLPPRPRVAQALPISECQFTAEGAQRIYGQGAQALYGQRVQPEVTDWGRAGRCSLRGRRQYDLLSVYPRGGIENSCPHVIHREIGVGRNDTLCSVAVSE